METKFSQVLRPWLGQLAICWVLAVVILVPVAMISSDRIAEKKIPWVKFTFEPRSAEQAEKLPADDAALRAWAIPLAYGNVRIKRETDDDGVLGLSVQFQSEQDVPNVPWQDLGYDQNSGTSSGTRWTAMIFEPNFAIWVQRASLVAAVGYLFFGIRSWRRRTISNQTCSTSKALLWGLGAAAVVSGLGVVASMLPVLGGAYPQTLPWFFEFTFKTVPGTVRTIFSIVGILLVPLAIELFFRQGLYASAAASGHARTGAIVSSLVPAMTLFLAPLTALLVVLTGLVNCWLLRRTGRLLAPVVCSTVATAAGFVLLWLLLRGAPSPTEWLNDMWSESQKRISDQLGK
ncbi:MAG: CPBP family intramembrane glutamic endopeptidase [Planctomycetota bacterium]|nr:CPBP family intramembrane glutamic endopeptidase [Planctomycetota bacterium]